MLELKIVVPWPKIRRLTSRMQEAALHVSGGVRSLAEEALADLKRRTPRSQEPGSHTADLWYLRYHTYKGVIRAIEFRNSPTKAVALDVLEGGAKPHIIKPVRSKALRFMVGGQEVYSAYVQHPGVKGVALVETTRRSLEEKLSSFMSVALDRWWKEV